MPASSMAARATCRFLTAVAPDPVHADLQPTPSRKLQAVLNPQHIKSREAEGIILYYHSS